MPVFSTLGALTYTKVYLGDTYYWYIETTPISSRNTLSTFDVNDDNIYWAGSMYNPANANVSWPNFINVLNSNFALPTDPYHVFYGSGNANVGQGTDVKFDSTANLIYFVSTQDAVVNLFNQTSGIVRTLDPITFAVQNTYVDLPTTTSRTRNPLYIETHANGTYTVAGLSQEVSSSSLVYVTNFTGNTKNWAKTLSLDGLLGFNVTQNNSFVVSGFEFSGPTNSIVELAGNGNTILRQYDINMPSPSFITTESSNIYFGGLNGANTNLAKIDGTGNIVWQKQMSSNVQTNSAIQIQSLTYGAGNIFVAGQANAPGGNIAQGLPLAIMSFNANSGNLNWQRRFYEANINFLINNDVAIKYEDGTLYVTATQTAGTDYGFMIKIPADGTILGNGTYANNLVYQTSNVAISNANISISTGNIVLSNAVSTAVVSSNFAANTSNLYTFNSTRLI
jgi:hypothetical protein